MCKVVITNEDRSNIFHLQQTTASVVLHMKIGSSLTLNSYLYSVLWWNIFLGGEKISCESLGIDKRLQFVSYKNFMTFVP